METSQKGERHRIVTGSEVKTLVVSFSLLGFVLGAIVGTIIHHTSICPTECPGRFAGEIKELEKQEAKTYLFPGHIIPKDGDRRWTYTEFLNAKAKSGEKGFHGWEVRFTLKGKDGSLKDVRVGIRNVNILDIDHYTARLVSKTYNPEGDIFKFTKEQLSGYQCSFDDKSQVDLCIPKDSIGKYLILMNNERE